VPAVDQLNTNKPNQTKPNQENNKKLFTILKVNDKFYKQHMVQCGNTVSSISNFKDIQAMNFYFCNFPMILTTRLLCARRIPMEDLKYTATAGAVYFIIIHYSVIMTSFHE
jgi:hypothetical protein